MEKLLKFLKLITTPFYYLDLALTSTPGMVLTYTPTMIALGLGIYGYVRDAKSGALGEGLVLVVCSILHLGGISIICSIVAIGCQLANCALRIVCIPGVWIYNNCRRSLNIQSSSGTTWQSTASASSNTNFEDIFDSSMRNRATMGFAERERAEERKREAERELQRQREEQLRRYKEMEMFKKGYEKAASQYKSLEEYNNALALFMLKEGYTEADLKKQYRRLLKAFHPDNDGSTNEEATRINAAYALLKKYAK